jgi:hypothetical protein
MAAAAINALTSPTAMNETDNEVTCAIAPMAGGPTRNPL